MFDLKLYGFDKLEQRLAHITDRDRARISLALAQAGQVVIRNTRAQFQAAPMTREQWGKSAWGRRGQAYESQDLGHRHLYSRSGTLKGSFVAVSDLAARGTRIRIGTPVPYAPVHEFGATINIPPHTRVAHQRKVISKGPRGGRRDETRKFGPQQVRGYTVTIPARPFLGPGLLASVRSISNIYRRAVADLLAGK